MPNAELIVNDAAVLDPTPQMPAVHAVLEVVFGTTMAELLLVQHAQLAGAAHLVPWRGLVVDSLPYDDLVTRLVQNGWTRHQVTTAIPQSHYFHLTSPFTQGFDFDNPLNRDWEDVIFDPSLRRLAMHPDAPGCAGTPALGRARVEGNELDLRAFFQRHLQALTQIRTETLALQPGVIAFLITTYRGGTGTGAATVGATILRSVMAGGDVHLHALMPCIYEGDDRAYTNAFAVLRETQWFHRYGGGVSWKGISVPDKAPFAATTYTFASNGAVSLAPIDALMQEAAILRAYLQVPTQVAISARRVDLTDVTPYDVQDQPMHVRVETALSIRTVHPGTQEYLVTEWVRQELAAVQERFEAWCQSGTLSPDEEAQVRTVVVQTLQDLHLDRTALLARLDPTPAPTNALRSFFEQATGLLGSMRAQAIKQSMAGLPTQVHDAFQQFETTWAERSRQLATTLPQEIIAYVTRTMAAAPHLALAALEQVRTTLDRLAQEATQEAEREKTSRDAANQALGPALSAVQEARGILWYFRTHEVARDAAHQACGLALTAALARAQQQRCECLVQALAGGVHARDSRGQPVTVPAVITALQNLLQEQIKVVRQRQAVLLNTLRRRLDDLGQQITKRSQVFQRSLLFDGMTRAMLDAEVRRIRTHVPDAPPVVAFLEGRREPQQMLAELLPLLPSYADSGRSLEEILMSDPGKRHAVVQLLRHRTPFTPVAREVEDQQGLRNRRDTLTILELPGGQDGPLAALMLKESVVTTQNHIVAADADEIRLYHLRDGLPYAAILPLQQYQQRYAQYLANPGAITPHTVPNAHQLPASAPARTNLRTHTQTLLAVVKAVLPDRLALRPSGGFVLRYDADTGYGGTAMQEEGFADFDALVGWVAQRAALRKAFEAELRQTLDADPTAYTAALLSAWQQATEEERRHLQPALFALHLDPNQKTAGAVNGHRNPAKANATSRRQVGARRKQT